MKTKQRPKFIWKKSTENRHVAYVGDGASISVERHRSWRTVNSTRPWMIDVLGHRCSHLIYGASFEEAQLAAEKELFRVLRSIEKHLRALGLPQIYPSVRVVLDEAKVAKVAR